LPEATGLDVRFHVAVGRGEHAHVDGDLGCPADRADLLLLQDPQELDLQRRRELADLVEQDRPAVGLAKDAERLGSSAREGTLLVAEELALHQRLGHRAAVDDDELSGATAPLVQESGDALFARAALAGDEHGGLRRRDLRDELVDGAHLLALAEVGLALEPRDLRAEALDSPRMALFSRALVASAAISRGENGLVTKS
jgi:hypothetical protein